MEFLRHPYSLGRGGRQGRTVIALIEGLERRSLLTGTLTPIPATFNLLAGTPPASPVAVGSFLDSDPTATAGDFTATINWGDGYSSAGTVTPPPSTSPPPSTGSGPFGVTGTHFYAKSGTYTVSVQVSDYQGDSTTITSMTYVAAPILLATGTAFNATPGRQFTEPAAIVTDGNPAVISDPSALTATINWGDGQTSQGTVSLVSSSNSIGTFSVVGTHTYAAPGTSGSYPVTVTITDPSGQTATASSTALVASPIVATGTTIPTTPGMAVTNQTVATFTDSNPNAASSTAVINWGDGQTSTGTVNATGSPDTFTVTGTHTYSPYNQAASFAVMVTIVDPSGQTGTADSTAVVLVSTGSSGGLADALTNGPHAASGFTNTNRPTFTGTASPYATVQLYARHFNADAQIPLGEAVASSTGQWTLTSGPLAVGTYIITATVTIPGGYPSNAITLTNANGKDLVYIDLSPRLVKWLAHGEEAVPHHHEMHPHHPTTPKPPETGHKTA